MKLKAGDKVRIRTYPNDTIPMRWVHQMKPLIGTEQIIERVEESSGIYWLTFVGCPWVFNSDDLMDLNINEPILNVIL